MLSSTILAAALGLLPSAAAQTPTPGHASASPDAARRARRELRRPKIAGIYPVYEIGGRWYLIDRFAKGSERSVSKGDDFVVIGSRATDVFEATGSSTTWGASCDGRNATKTPTLILGGKHGAKIGTPIVAIHLKKDKKINPKAARFYRLENQVGEDIYRAFGITLKETVTREIRRGEFAIESDDPMGRQYAADPVPENILLKIDFASQVKLAGKADTFFVVDGVVLSKSPRRCARLFLGDQLAGGCLEMPHALMAETNVLDFVAYDPNNNGRPFIMAYTKKEPLWGHERWGFRITSKGPSIFLMDALDPKCRERF
ncbi:MAG: hypothetical protein HY078_13195 [Elusimicrobia bacterium]|nr:hypothetical protein [Elusimicrobiota bacterium]